MPHSLSTSMSTSRLTSSLTGNNTCSKEGDSGSGMIKVQLCSSHAHFIACLVEDWHLLAEQAGAAAGLLIVLRWAQGRLPCVCL